MAHCKIVVTEGGKKKIVIGLNIPGKIVDLWESDKQDDARLELNYHITRHFENLHHKEKKGGPNT